MVSNYYGGWGDGSRRLREQFGAGRYTDGTWVPLHTASKVKSDLLHLSIALVKAGFSDEQIISKLTSRLEDFTALYGYTMEQLRDAMSRLKSPDRLKRVHLSDKIKNDPVPAWYAKWNDSSESITEFDKQVFTSIVNLLWYGQLTGDHAEKLRSRENRVRVVHACWRDRNIRDVAINTGWYDYLMRDMEIKGLRVY